VSPTAKLVICEQSRRGMLVQLGNGLNAINQRMA
jgi:hypothetical protein